MVFYPSHKARDLTENLIDDGEITSLDGKDLMEFILTYIFNPPSNDPKKFISKLLQYIPYYDFKSYIMNECLFNIYLAVKYRKYDDNYHVLVSFVKILMTMNTTFYEHGIKEYLPIFYKIDNVLVNIDGDTIIDKLETFKATDKTFTEDQKSMVSRNADAFVRTMRNNYKAYRYLYNISDSTIKNIIYGILFPKTIKATKKSLLMFDISTTIIIVQSLVSDSIETKNIEDYLNFYKINNPANTINDSIMISFKKINEMINNMYLQNGINADFSNERTFFMKMLSDYSAPKTTTFSKIVNLVKRGSI